MNNVLFKIAGIKRNNLSFALGICAVLVTCAITRSNAQTDSLLDTHDAMKLVTSQFGDVKITTKTHKHLKQDPPDDKAGSYNIVGEDRYLKKKEPGKRYDEFQVFDVGGLDRSQVTLGLLTNTLDRAIRYDEKGQADSKLNISTGYLGQLENNTVKLVRNENGNVLVSAIHFKDKYFLIIGDNDYRYVDGRRLVGDQKVVDELMQGKPITEITFFYELQKAGIVSQKMTVSEFTKLTASQKQRILNNGVLAGSV